MSIIQHAHLPERKEPACPHEPAMPIARWAQRIAEQFEAKVTREMVLATGEDCARDCARDCSPDEVTCQPGPWLLTTPRLGRDDDHQNQQRHSDARLAQGVERSVG